MNDEPSGSKPSWFEKLSGFFGDNGQDDTPGKTLAHLIHQAKDDGLLAEETAQMMEALLHIGDMQVRDTMIPRGQMILIEDHWSLERVLSVIIEAGHSRYPVVDADHKHIRGILISKDLLALLASGEENPDYLACIRSATIVPESKRLDAMLRDFRSNRNHMAMVMDEYGDLSGLITIEDVIEEIVGDIDDEHDEVADAPIVANADGSYQVKALTLIADFNERFATRLSDEDADTIGGFVAQYFGRMPVVGDSFELDNWQIHVSKANQRRVISLVVRPLPDNALV
ncbi:MAG: transporter associated domain-containing protein [Cardiobacteriaceae bacterium]|nr:transporter associated domain-containing protein [Cardiobacteriaceae bacterium]